MSTRLKQQTSDLSDVNRSSQSRKEWLSLSWLYPDSFGTPMLDSSYDSIVVRGDHEEYKFFVSAQELGNQKRGGSFGRWLEACEEVADHRICAPGLYRGVRALRWVDGEPIWLHDEPSFEFELPDSEPPQGVSDVAVVKRKVPREALLENLLRDTAEHGENLIERVARSLVGFHRSSCVASPLQHDSIVAASKSLMLESRASCKNLLAQTLPGSLLEFVCQELMSHLERFFIGPHANFGKAAKEGAVVDCHGALVMSNVAIDAENLGNKRPIFFGRPGKTENARINYLLSDVASLYLDMLSQGFVSLAEVLLDEYFRRAPETQDDSLLRSLVVFSALRRSSKIADECNLEPQAEQQIVSTLLATSYRVLLELCGPRVITLSGQEEPREAIALSLAQLLDAEICVLSGKPSEHAAQLSEAQRSAQSAIANGKPIIFCADSLSRPFLEFSIDLGNTRRLPVTNVVLNQQFENPSDCSEWHSFSASKTVEFESSLPLPEMCREILYTIQHQ